MGIPSLRLNIRTKLRFEHELFCAIPAMRPSGVLGSFANSPNNHCTSFLETQRLRSSMQLLYKGCICRLEPTSKAIAAERRDLVKQYEAAEAVQVPTVDMKIKARPSPEEPAARVVSPTGIPAAGSSVTDVDSTREVSQPPADSRQQQCAPHRTRAETTPQPVQVPSAQSPAAIIAQKPSPSRVDPTRSAPEASSGAPAEGVAQPLVAGQVQANSTSHELEESSEPRNGTSQGSELRGGFLGSALAGKLGKQAAPTAAQPAANTQAGQQTSPAASCTQHGSEAAQTEAPLLGGFLGKALSGKSRTENAAIPVETNNHAANAQPLQATSHIPSSEAIHTGATAQASTQRTGDDDDAAIGRLTTQKGEVPSVSSPADEIIAEVPPEKSTAAAQQVAHRALASKPATLRPPRSGDAACSTRVPPQTACHRSLIPCSMLPYLAGLSRSWD